MVYDRTIKYGVLIVGFFSVLMLGLVLSNGTTSSMQESLAEDTFQHVTIPKSGSLEYLDLNELDIRSELIVIGTVKEILPAKWNTQNGKRRGDTVDEFGEDDTIYTDIIVSVESYLKNPLNQEEIRVRIEGGEDELVSMSVDYEPQFKEGENVLIYLRKDTYPNFKDVGPKHYVVTGYCQGKFSLTDDQMAVRPYENPLKLNELRTAIMSGNYSKYETENFDGVPK